jgi:signal peptidase I
MSLPKLVQRVFEKGKTTKVISNSMFPKLKVGDNIKIITKTKPKFGDIIVYFSNKKLIVHRFYFKLKNKMITKGDNSKYFDKPWNYKKYIGVAKLKIKFTERLYSLIHIIKALPRIIKKIILKEKL